MIPREKKVWKSTRQEKKRICMDTELTKVKYGSFMTYHFPCLESSIISSILIWYSSDTRLLFFASVASYDYEMIVNFNS